MTQNQSTVNYKLVLCSCYVLLHILPSAKLFKFLPCKLEIGLCLMCIVLLLCWYSSSYLLSSRWAAGKCHQFLYYIL